LQNGKGRKVAKPFDDGWTGFDKAFVQPDMGVFMSEHRKTFDVGESVKHENLMIKSSTRVLSSFDDLVLG